MTRDKSGGDDSNRHGPRNVQAVTAPNKKGSSRITGKDALDLHEKEFAVPVTVRHPLNDLYSIVYAFQLARVHWPANPADDAPPVTL